MPNVYYTGTSKYYRWVWCGIPVLVKTPSGVAPGPYSNLSATSAEFRAGILVFSCTTLDGNIINIYTLIWRPNVSYIRIRPVSAWLSLRCFFFCLLCAIIYQVPVLVYHNYFGLVLVFYTVVQFGKIASVCSGRFVSWRFFFFLCITQQYNGSNSYIAYLTLFMTYRRRLVAWFVWLLVERCCRGWGGMVAWFLCCAFFGNRAELSTPNPYG